MSEHLESNQHESNRLDSSHSFLNWSLHNLVKPNSYDEPDLMLSVVYNLLTLLSSLCLLLLVWTLVKHRHTLASW